MRSKTASTGSISIWGRSGVGRSLPFRLATVLGIGAVATLALGAFTTVDAQAAAPKILYVSQSGLDSGSCTAARSLLNNSPVNARDLSLDGRELMGARTQRIQP
jgi:hypothetical protein